MDVEGDYKSPPSVDVMSDYDDKNSTKSSSKVSSSTFTIVPCWFFVFISLELFGIFQICLFSLHSSHLFD